MEKTGIILIAISVILIISLGVIFTRSVKPLVTVESVPIDKKLSVYTGGGGNSLVLISEDSTNALIVDTKMGFTAKKIAQAVKGMTVTIVNTHCHSDHTGGNFLFPGATIIAGAFTKKQWAHDAGKKSPYPSKTLQPGEEIQVFIGSETVLVRNMGRGHTWHDIVVYFVNRKLLATGDLVFYNFHPVLLPSSGTTVAGWVSCLNSLRDGYDVTVVVPGHGSVGTVEMIADMKQYFISAEKAARHKALYNSLKKKYDHRTNIPMISSFEKTVNFVKGEYAIP